MNKKNKVEKLIKDDALDKDNASKNIVDQDDDYGGEPFKVAIEDLKQSDTFAKLFLRDPAVLERIEADMNETGFDASRPLVTWKWTVVDGNCRFEIAKKLGITEVWIVDCGWDTEEEALKYAIHCQRARRNMKDADIISLVEKLDQLKKPGRKPDPDQLASVDANIGKSADKTASTIGTSTTKVEKTRKILKSDNPELIQAVKSGEKSINKGSQELAASKPAKATSKQKAGPDYKGVIKALNQAIKCCDTDKDMAEVITKVIDQVNTKMKEAGNTAKAK